MDAQTKRTSLRPCKTPTTSVAIEARKTLSRLQGMTGIGVVNGSSNQRSNMDMTSRIPDECAVIDPFPQAEGLMIDVFEEGWRLPARPGSSRRLWAQEIIFATGCVLGFAVWR